MLPACGYMLWRSRPTKNHWIRRPLAFKMTDPEGAPVADAAVTFRLPEDEPSGTFANGSRVSVVSTDTSGRALVGGIRWIASGTVSVRVTATEGTAHAGI